jgi:hypothetical protein
VSRADLARGHRRARVVALGVALVASGVHRPAARAETPWTSYATKNGVRYERRPVSGSKFFEHRASTEVAVAPAQAEEVIWRVVTERPPPDVKRRQVLRRTDDEVVVYDQFDTPVVRDRDATLRFSKGTRPDGLEVRFETTLALGPPPSPKYVRLPAVRGTWTVAAAPGGAKLTYVCYSEPGGSIPAFMVRGPQRDHVITDVERMLAFLRGS